MLAGRNVVLTWVVGAVGEPQLEIARAGGVHDVDAFQQVVKSLAAHPRVRMGDGAELVVLVLEDVRVDRADLQPELAGVGGQRSVVLDPVPGNVQRDLGGDTGGCVHLGRVGELLERVARDAGLGEDLEAGSRVPVAPRGRLDALGPKGVLHGGSVGHRSTSHDLNRFIPTVGRTVGSVKAPTGGGWRDVVT